MAIHDSEFWEIYSLKEVKCEVLYNRGYARNFVEGGFLAGCI